MNMPIQHVCDAEQDQEQMAEYPPYLTLRQAHQAGLA